MLLSSGSVLQNFLAKEGAEAIVNAARGLPQLKTICGLVPDQTDADFSNKSLDVGDAILLAYDMPRHAALKVVKCVPLFQICPKISASPKFKHAR